MYSHTNIKVKYSKVSLNNDKSKYKKYFIDNNNIYKKTNPVTIPGADLFLGFSKARWKNSCKDPVILITGGQDLKM